MGKQWGPGQAKKFAKELRLGQKYYTVREQSGHAATYGEARTYSTHVFTTRSGLTGVPMTAGGTSAIQLCRNQGPVHDAPPAGVADGVRKRDRDRAEAREFDKRARGLFGRW